MNVCLCCCHRYPACRLHLFRAPLYCHLWLAWLYHIFSTLSHKRYDFRKIITEHKMCVLIFSTGFIWRISHSQKKWARYDKKCRLIFVQTTRFSCPILMKLEFPLYAFQKYSSIKFHESPSSWCRVVPYLTKLIVGFRNFASAPKTLKWKGEGTDW
jgi:hypothetical protein